MMQRTDRSSIDDLLDETRSGDSLARARALQSLCPCHVKRNEPRVWARVLELVDDPSPHVRRHVLHLLGDGSPREREQEVVTAIERLHNDPDARLRRRVRQLLARYRRGGRINHH